MSACPNCDSKRVRRRKANLSENVRRRTKGAIHDPWICDNCGWSGRDFEIELPAEEQVDCDDPLGV